MRFTGKHNSEDRKQKNKNCKKIQVELSWFVNYRTSNGTYLSFYSVKLLSDVSLYTDNGQALNDHLYRQEFLR